MEEPQVLYGQSATFFAQRLFIRPDWEAEGRLLLRLAGIFLDELLPAGFRPSGLWTKRPGEGAKLNIGEFSERRWAAAVKKLQADQYCVLRISAENPDTHEEAAFSAHVNTPGGEERLAPKSVDFTCNLSFLRRLAKDAARVEAVLRLGTAAWDASAGTAAYGYAHVGANKRRAPFNPNGPQHPDYVPPWDGLKSLAAPAERVHPIPVAAASGEVDMNLETFYLAGKGVKGAFWANYLSAAHVALAGGEAALRRRLPGFRIEPLSGGGLLVVAPTGPLPEDSEENRARFQELHRALRPAFLSRAELPPGKHGLVGYFHREGPE